MMSAHGRLAPQTRDHGVYLSKAAVPYIGGAGAVSTFLALP